MHEVRKTLEFQKWLDGLNDARAYARIETRIFRLGLGLPGDVKAVGKGVSELRIDCECLTKPRRGRDEARRDAPQERARRATWFVVQGA